MPSPGNPTSPIKSGEGMAGRPGQEQPPPLSRRSCLVGVQARQDRGKAELTAPTTAAPTPALATPLHLTLPAACSSRRMGGTQVGKGSSSHSGWSRHPSDREGASAFQQGQH